MMTVLFTIIEFKIFALLQCLCYSVIFAYMIASDQTSHADYYVRDKFLAVKMCMVVLAASFFTYRWRYQT